MPGRARATDSDKVTAAAEAEAKDVTVVDGNGYEMTVGDPTLLNSLIYGRGFRVKDDAMSTSEAVATVTDPSAATGETPGS